MFGLFKKNKKIDVEPFPFPYKGMVAFNSDVEWTTWKSQLELIRFFHKFDMETAHSFWIYGDPNITWSLLDEDLNPTRYSELALEFIRSGLLDTLHSFGGIETGQGIQLNRSKIAFGLDFLSYNNAVPALYSNHGGVNDRQNIGGSFASYQEGDLVGSSYYHLDLSKKAGLRYFWCDPDYQNETESYRLPFGADGLIHESKARDGNYILRFRRHRGNLDSAPWSGNFKEQLKPIIGDPSGYRIIYQHFGVDNSQAVRKHNSSPFFDDETIDLLTSLYELQKKCDILVTTTRRLLDYAILQTAKPWTIRIEENQLFIDFPKQFLFSNQKIDLDWDMLDGFTISGHNGKKVFVTLKSQTRSMITVDKYAFLPWNKLKLQNVMELINQELVVLNA